MKEIELKERISHLERGLRLLGDDLEGIMKIKGAIEDIKAEIKVLKIYLGRVNPDFKSQYPEIVKKLKG
ncbi:MAG: hypothetical protein AABY78_04950 [Nitrospirota bacterium]|jgi:hypothetical protein|nr:hypothetical protein [Nitrospirota bacterium]